MGTKNKPGNFDCYANAHPDEPMFVLLGRDKHAGLLVRLWALLRANEEEEEKVAEAIACGKAMDAWLFEKKGIALGTNFGSDSRFEKLLLAASEGVHEHPEDYDYSCQCDLCLSYGE